MEGKYTEKLEQKQATSMEVIDAQKALDGRDRQIEVANDAAAAAQATADAALGIANRAHNLDYPYNASGVGNVALTAAYEMARKAHIRHVNPAVGSPVLEYACAVAENATALANKANALDLDHANANTNAGNWGTYLAYKYAEAAYGVGNHNHPYASNNHSHNEYASDNHKHSYSSITGAPNIPKTTGKAAGPGQHAHSISFTPFIKYPALARRAMLSLRREVRELAEKSESKEVRLLAEAVETAFKLQQDYIGLSAFDREKRLADPAWNEWSDNYRRVYGVDEYAEEDRRNYMGYGPVRMDPYEGIALS